MKVADNLSAKRAAATEVDGEIEEVDGGNDEDSSDLIFVLQTNKIRPPRAIVVVTVVGVADSKVT